SITESFSEKNMLRSIYYPSYLAYRSRLLIEQNDKFDYDDLFTGYSGRLKERLLTVFFINQLGILSTEQIDACRERLSKDINYQVYKAELDQSKMKSKSNTEYLDMELVDQHGHQFKLADLKGKVIFVDFWFSGCGGCIGYYNLVVSKVEPIVDKEKVVFVSICIDKDRDEWLKDIRSGKYTSEDAINVKLDNGGKSPISKAFGLTSYPFPVLLDRTG